MKLSKIVGISICLIIIILAPFAYHLIKQNLILAKVKKAKQEMRQIHIALSSYMIDFGIYPIMRSTSSSDLITWFRQPNGCGLNGLTTPITYFKKLPKDPFHSTPTGDFIYDIDGKCNWILTSNGPDGIKDIYPDQDYYKNPQYNLVDKTYDPTNGIKSSGDIWRTFEVNNNEGNYSIESVVKIKHFLSGKTITAVSGELFQSYPYLTGTDEGPYYMLGDDIYSVARENGDFTKDYIIQSILARMYGETYIGTANKGLYVIDRDKTLRKIGENNTPENIRAMVRSKWLCMATEHGVWYFDPATKKFAPYGKGGDKLDVWSIACIGDSIYCGTTSGLYRVSAPDRYWKKIGFDNRWIRTIWLNYSNPYEIWVGVDNEIFKSRDNTDTWIPLNNGLSGTKINFIILPYTGTSEGLFLFNEKRQLWTPISFNSTKRVEVTSLAIYRQVDEIFIGTRGDGLYRYSKLPEAILK